MASLLSVIFRHWKVWIDFKIILIVGGYLHYLAFWLCDYNSSVMSLVFKSPNTVARGVLGMYSVVESSSEQLLRLACLLEPAAGMSFWLLDSKSGLDYQPTVYVCIYVHINSDFLSYSTHSPYRCQWCNKVLETWAQLTISSNFFGLPQQTLTRI